MKIESIERNKLERIIDMNFDPIDKKIQNLENIINSENIPVKVEVKTKVKEQVTPSKFQKDIFNYIFKLAMNDPSITQKHLVVEAVAGSGKTWTIEQATKFIPKTKSACFLAFNKHIVAEFKTRAPENIKDNVMTLNSAGNRFVKNALDSRKKYLPYEDGVDNNNVDLILDRLFETVHKNFTNEEIDKLKPSVKKLVSMFKATNLEINAYNMNELIKKYGIETENLRLSDLEMLCNSVIAINKNILTNSWYKIDMNDQIWLPVALKLPVTQYDFVFIDETQDLNPSKYELAIMMCKPNGSIIAVGDRYQAIYGFTGSDINAIPNIIDKLNARVFPLDICYRCPVTHIKLAQKFVPHIQWATKENTDGKYDAREGSIHNIDLIEITDIAEPGDKVLCRITAPLIHPCYDLIRNEKKAAILGKSIGKGLENLITKKIKGNNIQDFTTRLERWKDKEIEKLTERKLPIEPIMDQYETIIVLMEGCKTIPEIVIKIKKIFSAKEDENGRILQEDTEDTILFSTIHRAKGLEVKDHTKDVFVIMSHNDKSLMPSPWAKEDWEFRQELNLQYVAFTRGKDKLYLVDNIKNEHSDLITKRD